LGGWTTLILSIFGNGFAAVNLFFVISGFVLLQSLMRGPDPIAANTSRFVIARVFRIYPAAVATIGLFYLVFAVTGAHISDPATFAPMSLLRNVLLIGFSINGVMWTLKLEIIAVPLLIVGFLLFRYLGGIALAVLLTATLILENHWQWVNLVDTPFGLRLLPFFAVGMIVFAFGRKVSEWCPAPLASVMLILAAVGTLALQPLLSIEWESEHHIEMVCDGVIVGLLAFGSIGRLGKFFDNSIVRFYGRISYSFYLVNPLTLLVYWNSPDALGRLVLGSGIPGIGSALIMFVTSVAVTTPIAWLMYRYVERPGISIGKSIAARLLAESPLLASR
jgi:peptidoglycan/LPS O-acetylase OafA/YrhL